jgi:hypothetical protein
MNFKYRYTISRINKEIRATRQFYKKELEKLKRVSTEHEQLLSEYGAQYQLLDYRRKSIITDYLLSKADELLLPVPNRVDGNFWEDRTFGPEPVLSEQGINYLKTLIREERKRSFEIFSFIRENIAIVTSTLIGGLALYVSISALNAQRSQARTQLWHSLRHEFAHELVRERKSCAKAYLTTGLDFKYGPVMDFFDLATGLVHSNDMDLSTFKDNFSYYFYGYFKATEKYMSDERKRDPEIYEDIFKMAKELPAEPSLKTKADIDTFFMDESNLAE